MKKKSKMKFLLDEEQCCCTDSFLYAEGFNVKRVKLGMSDEINFQRAYAEKRTLVTSDRDYYNNSKFPFQNCSCLIKIPNHHSHDYISTWSIILNYFATHAHEVWNHKIEFKSSETCVIFCQPGSSNENIWLYKFKREYLLT